MRIKPMAASEPAAIFPVKPGITTMNTADCAGNAPLPSLASRWGDVSGHFIFPISRNPTAVRVLTISRDRSHTCGCKHLRTHKLVTLRDLRRRAGKQKPSGRRAFVFCISLRGHRGAHPAYRARTARAREANGADSLVGGMQIPAQHLDHVHAALAIVAQELDQILSR
jgi:hypothetical protein